MNFQINKPIFSVNLLGLILILLTVNNLGQSRDGTIFGLVKDQNGALIPGAEVILNKTGDRELTVRTDNQGNFIFRNLLPGTYKLTVKFKGFKDFVDENVELTGNQNKNFEVSLTIETKETVTIGENGGLGTEPDRNTNSIVLRGKDLDILPDNPEDLASVLAALTGGVGPDGAEFLIDGFSGAGVRLPNRRQISEVRINQNPFTAEYDRIGFGRVSLSLSPTTEKFHGEGEFYFSDESLNSRNPFSSNRPPFQVRNIFGSLSGPLVKKKASFYIGASREAFDSNAVVNAVVLNNQFVPVAISRGTAIPERELYTLFRVDYKISKNTDLVLNYQYLPNETTGVGIGQQELESRGYTSNIVNHIYRILGTTIISPKTVYQYRMQFTDNTNKSTPLETTPSINVLGAFTSGGADVGNSNTKTVRLEVQNHITTTVGTNALRFGGTYRYMRIRDNTPFNFNGSYTFEGGVAPQLDAGGNIILGSDGQPIPILINSLEAYRRTLFLRQLGISPAEIRRRGGGATQFSISVGNPLSSVKHHDIGVYAQYDWRVSPALNLGLGLRYEIQTNVSSNSNFAPRLSFAWAPGAKGTQSPKMVVRGGFGIFYGRILPINVLQANQFDGIRQQNYISNDPTVLDFYPLIPPTNLLGNSQQSETIRRLAADLRTSYSYQTALSVERQLNRRTTFSATFILARYLHLLRSRNINAPLPDTFDPTIPNSGIRPFPDRGNIFLFESSGVLNQKQLIFNLTSRLNPKISIFSTFTLNSSKADNNGAGSFPISSYDFSDDYGYASNDVRLRLNFGATLETLWGIRLSPYISARSGIPFNIITGRDTNGDNLFTERPAFATDLSKPGVVVTNYGAFDLNPGPDQKIIPLNYGRGPEFFVFNLRATKSIPFGPGKLREGAKNKDRPYNMTLSVAVTNLFNRNNAAIPIGNLSSPLFGISTASSTEGGSSNADSNRRVNFSIAVRF
ncbi:TonB-dependent receptor [Planktothrix sp. FACHB-1355]|uniref:TonB-dependent receptor n=1 Tax=Planktothrix sp. FACHB-1355 TaxID=2692854 RepID=UPI00168BA835|nr:carboxypeptidase-like regulatory domain-containing protein [Planktothrix sp. FACHB-1355]MBD3557663.1 TonB-dependent receptor [Planktothrix sp. FACHB-1355]